MTTLPPDVATTRAFLRAAGRAGGPQARWAIVFTIMDVFPAAAFALGLTLALTAYPHGAVAMAPGLAVAVASLIARGLLAHLALGAGGQAAQAVKAGARDRVLAGLFGGRPAAVSTAVEGVEALDGHFTRFEPIRVSAAVSPLLLIGLAAAASPVAAAILLFTLIPFGLGMMLAGTAAAGESRRQFAALSALSGLFLDRVRALPAVIAFQAQTRVADEVAQAARDLQRRTARVLRIAFLSSGVLEFFSALSVALVAVYCGFNLLRLLPFPVPETLDLGRAFFVLALAPEVYAPLRRLAAAYHDRQAAEAAAPTLAAALAPEVGARSPAPLLQGQPAIRFDALSIRYGEAPPVLDGFDLDIRPGQMVAITGPSGAGKSSLLHALLGLAPVSGGRILVDGAPLTPDGLGGRVGWAGQSPVVVPGSVLDNIRLARRDASTRDLLAAAEAAGLTVDLDRIIDERGGGLSGGERRRLGLARAFLKDAPILLLDEPTANLDHEAGVAMIEVIRNVAQGRTTLIATHSAAVAALADRVVRL